MFYTTTGKMFFAQFGSLAIIVNKGISTSLDIRPMTLRHQFSLVLLFGSRSLMTFFFVVLEPGLCAASFHWFYSFDSRAI